MIPACSGWHSIPSTARPGRRIGAIFTSTTAILPADRWLRNLPALQRHPSYNRPLSLHRSPTARLWARPHLRAGPDPTSSTATSWHNGGRTCSSVRMATSISVMATRAADNDQYHQTQKINSGMFSGVFRIDVDMNPSTGHPILRQPVPGIEPPAGWPATYTANYYHSQ